MRLSPSPSEAGSSLPELLLAAGLTLIALGMLATTVLGPLSMIAGWGVVDERQLALTRSADTVVSVVALARPGLAAAAVVSAGSHRIELRVGDLRHARRVVLLLADGQLRVELPDGPMMPGTSGVPGASLVGPVERVVIGGLDTRRSSFSLHSVSGEDLTALIDTDGSVSVVGSTRSDVAVIKVALIDPNETDGSPGRTVIRSAHLRLRLPLAAGDL